MKTKFKLTPGRIVTAVLRIAGISFLMWRAGWYNDYVANLPEWEVEGNVLKRYNGSAEHVVIGHGIEEIGPNAFEGHYEIKTVDIPDSVTYIGWYAFRDCTGLESVSLPVSLKEIGPGAFYDAELLGHVEFPEGLGVIHYAAFSGCKLLTFDSLPQSLKGIGASAFKDCDSLVTVEIPVGVRSLEEWVFGNCENLTDVYIPDTVQTVQEFAFENSDKVVIHCTYYSAADKYARETGMPIEYDMPIVNFK